MRPFGGTIDTRSHADEHKYWAKGEEEGKAESRVGEVGHWRLLRVPLAITEYKTEPLAMLHTVMHAGRLLLQSSLPPSCPALLSPWHCHCLFPSVHSSSRLRLQVASERVWCLIPCRQLPLTHQVTNRVISSHPNLQEGKCAHSDWLDPWPSPRPRIPLNLRSGLRPTPLKPPLALPSNQRRQITRSWPHNYMYTPHPNTAPTSAR